MIIANIATYPQREGNRRKSINSIARQVDRVNVALNNYTKVPRDLKGIKNANFFFPEDDLKDLGKFAFDVAAEDDVFLCDDDIIYPHDYVSSMMNFLSATGNQDVVIGLHGVIYSDYYDGQKRSGRFVHVFHRLLEDTSRVNQLGTGTVHLKGKLLPNLKEMSGASGYTDIKFARLMFDRRIPLYAVARDADWLTEVINDSSLYLEVTSNLPIQALREVQVFCGLSKLAIVSNEF